MKITRIFVGLALGSVLVSCGTQKSTTKTASKSAETGKYIVTNGDQFPVKTIEMSEEQINGWPHMDVFKDSVPGMSLAKAYDFIKDKKPATITVAVIDSGIDIEHEDLKDVIWVNTDEIPNNGKDDDNNGYIDDIHGWNFLGGEKGKDVPEQLELTRIVSKLKKKYDGKTEDQVNDKDEFKYYTKLKSKVDKKYKEAKENLTFYQNLSQALKDADAAIKKSLNKDSYTVKEAKNTKLDESLEPGKQMVVKVLESGASVKDQIERIQGGVDYFKSQTDFNLNVNFNGRLTKDNPDDFTDNKYGNNMVMGCKDTESHGTHCSGIILAGRNNGVGMNGVTQYAKLMSVRAVPDGDEYDKDIALAIRYAADNGAKVVSMSFGKSFSSHPEWVYDAIKYAESKDVLLVHAAGNDSKDIDIEDNFPNDAKDKVNEFADNMLTIGAMTRFMDENIPASFSNYGIKNVDVFAPGHKIYSTYPKNEYKAINGTSMACPEVAGVAALVRSVYPSLTASQVKHIIMDSAVKFNKEVLVPYEDKDNAKKESFKNLSVSGGVLNAYNALKLADKITNGK